MPIFSREVRSDGPGPLPVPLGVDVGDAVGVARVAAALGEVLELSVLETELLVEVFELTSVAPRSEAS